MGWRFDRYRYKRLVSANLSHLETIGLNLDNKTVLEPGAGIGLLTAFFEQRGCTVLSTEGRQENVDENLRRHPHRGGHVRVVDLMNPHDHDGFGPFDIIFCYGVLYHISDPAMVIESLSRVCKDLFLLETRVALTDSGELHFREEANQHDQSLHGIGCIPSRDWIMNELKKHFKFVYLTRAQPDHPAYPLKWPVESLGESARGWPRSVFVASHKELSLPTLSSNLVMEQERIQTKKICVVKHPYYMNWAWESARYESPDQMLRLFRYRSQNLSFVIGKKVDMWIVEGKTVEPAFAIDRIAPKVFRALYKAQPAVSWSEIPWGDYDIVITIDPILNKKQEIIKKHPNILWVYNEPSHRSGRAQAASRGGPLKPYDLFWDDFMRAPYRLTKLPQPISFPYLANPDIMRALIKPKNENGVFIDSRHIVEHSGNERMSMVREFQDICGLPICHAPLDGQITEKSRYIRSLLMVEGKMLECDDYLRLLGSSKYYLAWRRKKTNGQGALEAASLGLIVIASKSGVYSKMLCHPTCLILPGGPPRIGLRLIQKIERDPNWQAEILAYQDKMLWEKFWDRPIDILYAALDMKRSLL